MKHGKYVILKDDMPYLIPEAEKHNTRFKRSECISAGFWDIINNEFRVYGESISLGLKSRLEDSDILNIFYGGKI